MELSEVIHDLNLKGSRSHRNYDIMVAGWYVEEGNEIPSLETCIETWNKISTVRILSEIKTEKILQVKTVTNEELSKTDWKIIKHQETNYLTQNEFDLLKNQRQMIREQSNNIETTIFNLKTIELVRDYKIEF